MSEDAQPNDFRGRQARNISVLSTRRAVPRPRNYSSSARPSYKRPFDHSYPSSPAKRRRIENQTRKEITKELPIKCRKGVPDCHRERKRFIDREIERLQESRPGLQVTGYMVEDSRAVVHFYTVESDLLHTSLAPRQTPQDELNQTEVELLSQDLSSCAIVSVMPGPPRFYKSGTITFKPKLSVSKEVVPQPVVTTLASRVSDADETSAPTSLSEKPGPPPRKPTKASTSDVDTSAAGSLITGTSRPHISKPSEANHQRTTVPRSSRVSELEFEEDLPLVAELLFGKQGPPLPKPKKAAVSVTPAVPSSALIGCISVSSQLEKSQSPRPRTQALLATQPSPPRAAEISLPVSTASASEYVTSSTSHALELSRQDYSYVYDGDALRIPIRQQHDKLRRFLSGSTPSTSFVVSMYGVLEGVDVASRKHWLISSGSSLNKEAIVDDACLVTTGNHSIPVLGHSRDEEQLSLLKMDDDGVVSAIDLKRPWNSKKKGGVSAVAPMMQPLSFASGGYDHVIHFWTLEADLSSASPQPLNIKHNSQVQSLLAIQDSSHKLISAGADCSVHIWDLSSERVVHTHKPSSSVYHVHPTSSPFCTLLEVAHRELQFEVRDHRIVPETPVQRFGYACPQLRFHGRYMKGAALSDSFASGDRAGNVRVWDLRNTQIPRAEIECFPGQKIAHVVFQSSRLLACSENNQIQVVQCLF